MSLVVDDLGLPDPEQRGISALTADEHRNLDTMARVVPYWNRHDVEGILAHYDDEITWRNVAMGETYVGKAAVGDFLSGLFRAIPDLSLTITKRVPRGNFVAEEYTIGGTHLGNLFGIPATGRSLELRAVSFVQMRDGKLQEDHFYFDTTGILHQMGLFPPLTVAQTPVGHILMGVVVFLRSPQRAIRVQWAARKSLRSRG